MKRLILFAFLAFCISCDYFDKKKIDTEDLVEEELKAINWYDVDEYPTFSICEGSTEKKNCFETVLRDNLNTHLSNQNIIVTEDINDTIILKIHIDNAGGFTIKDIIFSELTKSQIPQLDTILRRSFDSLPKLFPAIKRGQQVATEFNLPVVININ